jgi:predicted DNA binding CopG/RHH family protein
MKEITDEKHAIASARCPGSETTIRRQPQTMFDWDPANVGHTLSNGCRAFTGPRREVSMKEELKRRNFRNEAEEAQWWEQNQDTLAHEFEKAAAAGTLGHGTAARKGATPTTTIRLDPEDIVKARAQAEHRGLRYQTYLKMLIHEALQRAERSKAKRG